MSGDYNEAVMKGKLPKIKPGDTVPSTGLYHVDKGTRIIPVSKLKQERKAKREGRRGSRR